MAKIAFILLCHKDVDEVIAQARALTVAGDVVAIHFDARASAADFARLRDGLADDAGVVFARRRVKCGWGEWSLVQATLNALEAAAAAFPAASHFYLLSGDCRPIKSAAYVHAFLDDNDKDFIESFDFFTSDWIKIGLKEERLVYRHFFNERQQKRLFYAALAAQERLGLKRRIPADLEIMIGSQWWCLRRNTVEAVLEFTWTRRDVVRFFRRSWIPDETFFQTLVRHLVPMDEIETRPLTFLLFSDYGLPVVFYNDHYDMLLGQDYLFARKVSPEAQDLKARLAALYASGRTEFTITDEGARLFRFLAGRGRIGIRHGPRFWERHATIGRDRTLLIVACKKWHVAKRLLDAVRFRLNTPAIEYLFDEEDTALPDLGGIEATIAKRTRHRRAVLRMLFDHYRTDTLIVCLDPARIELVDDFYSDRCDARLLEIECEFTDDYLAGHAQRVGLAGDRTPQEVLGGLIPAIRQDIYAESDALRDRRYPEYHRLRQSGDPADNAAALASFLSIPQDGADSILSKPHLFDD